MPMTIATCEIWAESGDLGAVCMDHKLAGAGGGGGELEGYSSNMAHV